MSQTGQCPRCRLPRLLIRRWIVHPQTKVRRQTDALVIEAHETASVLRERWHEYPILPELVPDRVELAHCSGSGEPAYVAPPLRAWRCIVQHFDDGEIAGPTRWGSPSAGEVKAEAAGLRHKYGPRVHSTLCRAEFLGEREILEDYDAHLRRVEQSHRDYMAMLTARTGEMS